MTNYWFQENQRPDDRETILRRAAAMRGTKLGESAQRVLSVAAKQDGDTITFFRLLEDSALRTIAKSAASLTDQDLVEFVKLLPWTHVFWNKTYRNVPPYLVQATLLLLPVTKVVSGTRFDGSDMKQHCVNRAVREHDPTLSTWFIVLRRALGSRYRIGDETASKLRGRALMEASGKLISEADFEWFGSAWQDVIAVWGQLESHGVFTRSYAESLIEWRSAGNGTTLADGVL